MKKAAFQESLADSFLDRMRSNYGKALQGFKSKVHPSDTPIDVQEWYDHVSAYFRADNAPSTVDVLEGPVVDNTDAFTEPTLSYFEGALQRAIVRLDSTSSAGLDGIPTAFVKHMLQEIDLLLVFMSGIYLYWLAFVSKPSP
jgi:hypothetical protein